jgi:predicted nucleic acid-binding protein
MRYLLDTTTCIAAMRHHVLVLQRIAPAAPVDCAISSITTYELYTGIGKCANPAKELAKVNLLRPPLANWFLTARRRGKRGVFALCSNRRAA